MRPWVIAAVLVTACAPSVDGPREQQHAIDAEDSTRLAAQLSQLPGAVRADVTLHRPLTDPFTQTLSPGSAAVLVVVDERADRAGVTDAARALVRGVAPEIPEPAVVVELGAVRPHLVQVGPFTVDAASRGRVVAALAAAFAALAALAAWIVWRERWRVAG